MTTVDRTCVVRPAPSAPDLSSANTRALLASSRVYTAQLEPTTLGPLEAIAVTTGYIATIVGLNAHKHLLN